MTDLVLDPNIGETNPNVDAPSSDSDTPNLIKDVPSTIVNVPDANVEAPSAQISEPDSKVETSSVQVSVPDLKVEAMTMEIPEIDSKKKQYLLFGAAGVVLLIIAITTGVLVNQKSDQVNPSAAGQEMIMNTDDDQFATVSCTPGWTGPDCQTGTSFLILNSSVLVAKQMK